MSQSSVARAVALGVAVLWIGLSGCAGSTATGVDGGGAPHAGICGGTIEPVRDCQPPYACCAVNGPDDQGECLSSDECTAALKDGGYR